MAGWLMERPGESWPAVHTLVCMCGCAPVQQQEWDCNLEVSYAQVPATGETGIWGQTECLSPAPGRIHLIHVYIYVIYIYIHMYISHCWTSILLSLGGKQDEGIGASVCLCTSVWQPHICLVYMCAFMHVPTGNTCSALLRLHLGTRSCGSILSARLSGPALIS